MNTRIEQYHRAPSGPEKLSEQILVRLPLSKAQELRQRANRSGMTPAAFLRYLLDQALKG